MNEFRMCLDPIRAVSFHMAATRGIVSHAARAAPYHYLCHGTTPLFSRTSIFDTPVSLCFCDAFSVDAIERFSAVVNCRCGLEHSSLHSTRTTKVFDVVPRGYNLLHLFSFVLEENCRGNVTMNEIVRWESRLKRVRTIDICILTIMLSNY